MKLRIAPDLTLPVDAVTQTIGILAKRRVGKSYTSRRFAEQFFKAGQQIVIVDPKGDHWGIRSSADGKSPGLPVVILGGERGDVPLEVGSGETVAQLVVEERVSVLLDLSLFRKHEVATFMTAFLENLYRLKAKETNRTPLMLIVDEADAIMPQKPQPNEARMLGAGEDIVRRGGQRGIGCMLITQRSAVLNKNVLTQCEMIVALRTIAPQDLKALDAWIEVHGEPEQRETLMSSLPALPVGDAWFWSPGWPTVNGIFKRVHVSPIETFDSGASPKAGEKRAEPKNLADVDLGALTKKMADTIERKKADDPKELRKQLAERDKTIRQMQKGGTATKTVEKPVRDEAAIEKAVSRAVIEERRRFRPILATVRALSRSLGKARADIVQHDELLTATGNDLAKLLDSPEPALTAAVFVHDNAPPARTERATPPVRREATAAGEQNGDLSRPQLKILNVMASLDAIGQATPKRSNVAVLSGVSSVSSGFEKNLSQLRTGGYIEYPSSGLLKLTMAGEAIAVADVDFRTRGELHDAWCSKVSGPQANMIRALVRTYPSAMTREDLAAEVNVSASSSGFEKNLSVLRSLGVVDYPRSGEVVATDMLFPEGLS